jgi:toxin CptA
MSPMSSTVSVIPLALEIKPSRLLAIYLICVYATAALVVLILPVSLWLMCCALLSLLLSGAFTYRHRISLRSRNSIVGLNRNADGTWQLRLTGGAAHQASLQPDSYLHPELLVLNFKLGNGKRRSVVLVRDSADCTSLRRLRVALALRVRESVA